MFLFLRIASASLDILVKSVEINKGDLHTIAKVSQPRDKRAGTFKPVHSLGRSPKDEVRPLLVNREPRIADFQHVEIVPCSWACKSSDRNDLVDDVEQVIPGRGRADVISMKSRRTQLHKRMS